MSSSELMQELKIIREELQYIREHMVDTDMILTPDEEELLEESLQDYRDGKTTKLSDLKREDD
ncbi:MAG: hypothetical protein Q7J68_02825 [Thermoplasmata archaeon]|nr:hypothetical protein [Thermoplasmata archaeon]